MFIGAVGITYAVSNSQYGPVLEKQKEHIAALRAEYASPDFTPLDEQSFCSFDLGKAADISYADVRFFATHNSYKYKESAYSHIVNGMLSSITDDGWGRWSYYFDSITDQLNRGIRSVECDVYAHSDGSFEGSHHPIMDRSCSTLDFALAMDELVMWSEHNPGHIPVTILLEPKPWFIPLGGHDLEQDDFVNLDALLKSKFGDKLVTPSQMLGEFENFEDFRNADAWPSLESLRGKFIFMLHPTSRTPIYMNMDKSLSESAMFPAYDKRDVDLTPEQLKMTCFVLCNYPDIDLERIAEYDEQNYVIRTRTDIWPEHKESLLNAALESKANILSTDYPPRVSNMDRDAYTLYGVDGKYTVTIKP